MKTIVLFGSGLAISVAISTILLLPACASDRSERLQKLEQRFRDADKDSNGELTEVEAQAGLPKLAKNFSQVDTDQSGTISMAEIKTAIAKHGQR